MPINLNKLISLISKSKMVIANDTGPAHIASHLKKRGVVLFGSHTSADKVNLGNENFRVISVKKLSELKVETVMEKVKVVLD